MKSSQIKSKSKMIFVTGTNTDVGKTYISEKIISHLLEVNKSVAVYKPIETGCRKINKKLVPLDSGNYYKLLNKKIPIDVINPFRFIPPISPNRAIKLAKKKIYIKNFVDKFKDFNEFEYVLVEGAGGLCSPISLDGLNIDLIKKLGLDCILVARDEIGVINNVLLCINTLKQHKVGLKAVVLNRIVKKQPKGMDNASELTKLTKIPIIQFVNGLPNKKAISKLIKLSFK